MLPPIPSILHLRRRVARNPPLFSLREVHYVTLSGGEGSGGGWGASLTWYALAPGLGPPQILRSAQNYTGIQGARKVDSRFNAVSPHWQGTRGR